MAKEDHKKIIITAIDQYIIDAVRSIRLNLDLSQKILSARLSSSGNTSKVGQAESVATNHKYTDADLHEIAHIFTDEAMKIKHHSGAGEYPLDFQTEYTLHDFYPKEPLPDILVVKSKNIMISKIYPTGAVGYLIEETDFLNDSRTTKEVTEEVNRLFEKKWKTTDLGSPLDRAVVKGDLIKTEPPLQVTYQKLRLGNNS